MPHCAQNFESTAARIPHSGQKRILPDADGGCCGGDGCGGRGGSVCRTRVGIGSMRRGAGAASADRLRQRCDDRLLRVRGLVGLRADILDRGHRGQRSILERLVHRFVVRVRQLAHLAIEFEFAKTLHRERALMLVALDLKLAVGLGARADQPDAERSRDEQRDSGDDQRGGEDEHRRYLRSSSSFSSLRRSSGSNDTRLRARASSPKAPTNASARPRPPSGRRRVPAR